MTEHDPATQPQVFLDWAGHAWLEANRKDLGKTDAVTDLITHLKDPTDAHARAVPPPPKLAHTPVKLNERNRAQGSRVVSLDDGAARASRP